MERYLIFGNLRVLLTTGADREECQAWTWFDEADVVVSIGPTGAKIIKGDER